jgi:hypothetical protein
MQDDLNADAIDLETVVYGPGIGMLKADSAVAKRVADAKQACRWWRARTRCATRSRRAAMLPGVVMSMPAWSRS